MKSLNGVHNIGMEIVAVVCAVYAAWLGALIIAPVGIYIARREAFHHKTD